MRGCGGLILMSGGRNHFTQFYRRRARKSRATCAGLSAAASRVALPRPEREQKFPVVWRERPAATLHRVAEADHSFHVLARSGRNDGEVMREILDALSDWIGTTAG